MRKITGSQVNYFFVCKRKLWLFSNHIQMEQKSDLVAIGKLIDETTYSREKKHITIDETISIDFVESNRIINEIKKSKSIEDADIWQLKYYLYYLQKRGVEDVRGVIRYPKLKEKVDIDLTTEDIEKLDSILKDIEKIIDSPLPPERIKTGICKNCSYFELCFI